MLNYQKIYNSVSKPSFRIWKVITDTGATYQNELPISSSIRLKNFVGTKPCKLYVSVGLFLNPHLVSTKIQKGIPGYKYANRIFLGSDLYFDLDSEHDLTIAQSDARKIMSYMLNRTEFRFKEIVFSGNKGLKLYYEPKNYNPWKEADPIKRRELTEQRYRLLVADMFKTIKLQTMDINHANIACDSFRVCPADYSYKKYQVLPLDTGQFFKEDIYSLISPVRSASEGSNRQAKPAKPYESQVAIQSYQGRRRSCISSYPISYLAITNVVPGLKGNYVPMMKIPIKKFRKVDLKDLSRDIGHFLILEDNDQYYWIVGFKPVQHPKLMKIYKRCFAVNRSELSWRGYNLFHVSNVLDKNENSIKDNLKVINVISSEKKYLSSAAHASFFNKHIHLKDTIGKLYNNHGDKYPLVYKVVQKA